MALVTKEEIAGRLKEVMAASKKNSRQFAMAAGLDVSYFSKIENGKKPLSKEYLDKIESTYNVNKDWLLTGKGQMFRPNVPHETSVTIVEEPETDINFRRLSLEKSIENLTQNELKTSTIIETLTQNEARNTAIIERLVSLLEKQYGKEVEPAGTPEPGGEKVVDIRAKNGVKGTK